MDKIKIAVDSCVVIMMSRLASETLNDKDKAVIDCLKRKALTPELYEDTPYRFLPPILKDNYLGDIEFGEDGKKYYNNLLDIYRLWDAVEKRRVEVYITPTVLGELDFEWFDETIDFIDKYINIIKVKDEDSKKFYSTRDNLAWEYVRNGAMQEAYSGVIRASAPENDAFIMAEASLCGLVLVTANKKHFLNYNKYKDDYKRVAIIQQVNTKAKLVFNSNIDNFVIPAQPLSLRSFILKSRYTKRSCTKPYYIVNPKIAQQDKQTVWTQ